MDEKDVTRAWSLPIVARARSASTATRLKASLIEVAAAVLSPSVGVVIWSNPFRPRFGGRSNALWCCITTARMSVRPCTGIHSRSGCRCREIGKLTSNTNRPEANSPGLWMTRPADNPKYRLRRSHIQYESGRSCRRASGLSNSQQLLTQEFVRDFDLGSASQSLPFESTFSPQRHALF